MANDYNNEMWESLLKATVIKNSLDDLENYPSEKINKVVLPEHYDYKVRILRNLFYKGQDLLKL